MYEIYYNKKAVVVYYAVNAWHLGLSEFSSAMSKPELSSISSLPAEVLERVLSFVASDDLSLLRAEAACAAWRCAIRAAPIYRRKCLAFRRSNPDCATAFLRHRFLERSESAEWCKGFYFGLRRLKRRGWARKSAAAGGSSSFPAVKVVDTLAAEVNGVKVDLSDSSWSRRHNYTGVYDMVYDQEAGRLFCSVYDTIQVWDANSLTCLRILGPGVLDRFSSTPSSGGSDRTICFHASGDVLACGTQRGDIRLFDIWSQEVCHSSSSSGARLSSPPVVDLKISGDELLSIDCFGSITEWRIDRRAKRLVSLEEEVRPPLDELEDEEVRELYSAKNVERIIDFNSEVVATNTRELLALFSRPRTGGRDGGDGGACAATFVKCRDDILCLKVLGRAAYWGVMRGTVYRADLYLSPPASRRSSPAVISDPESECARLRTRFRDNITSLDVSEDSIVIGDVNGEVHICSLDRFGTNKNCEPDYVIDSEFHE